MNGREAAIWSGAIVLSLLVHGLLWLKPADMPLGDERVANAERTTTRVTFRAQAAPPDMSPAVQPPREPQTKPVVEEMPKPKPLPKPKSEKPPKPTPKPTQRAEKQPVAEPVDKQPEAHAEVAPQTQEQPATGMIAEQALSPAARDAYLQQLLAHIETNKQYPRAARRRHIEGVVMVSFELLADGSYRGLTVSGGHGLLDAAAEDAVKDSVPMPVPPKGMKIPLQVQFEMVFTLR